MSKDDIIKCSPKSRCETMDNVERRVDYLGRDMYNPEGKIDKLQRNIIYAFWTLIVTGLIAIGGSYIYTNKEAKDAAQDRTLIRAELQSSSIKIEKNMDDNKKEIIDAIKEIKKR